MCGAGPWRPTRTNTRSWTTTNATIEVYYGILEIDLDPDTLLTLGADYQDNNPKGSSWSGSASLFNSAGERISTPRSFNNGAKWSSWKQYAHRFRHPRTQF